MRPSPRLGYTSENRAGRRPRLRPSSRNSPNGQRARACRPVRTHIDIESQSAPRRFCDRSSAGMDCVTSTIRSGSPACHFGWFRSFRKELERHDLSLLQAPIQVTARSRWKPARRRLSSMRPGASIRASIVLAALEWPVLWPPRTLPPNCRSYGWRMSRSDAEFRGKHVSRFAFPICVVENPVGLIEFQVILRFEPRRTQRQTSRFEVGKFINVCGISRLAELNDDEMPAVAFKPHQEGAGCGVGHQGIVD